MTRTVLKRLRNGAGEVVAFHETAEERQRRISRAAAAAGSQIRFTKGQRSVLREARRLNENLLQS